MRKLKIKPDPDFNRLLDILERRSIPDRIPLFEIWNDIEVEHKILEVTGLLENGEKDFKKDELLSLGNEKRLRKHIRYMYNLGYDYINVEAVDENLLFPRMEMSRTMTREGYRNYIRGSDKVIENNKDFEEYPWPDMDSIDYSAYELTADLIPDGMKVISLSSGPLEITMGILGFEGISYLLYENEKLVSDTFEAVSIRILDYFDKLASLDVIGALVLGDDMGFKTSTMLSPKVYRKFLFPWHKKMVEIIHKHGKPAIIHSCGNLKHIMHDIINCGWDAKHSFEDGIQPIWEAKKEYGDELAVLGGFDMDKLCRMSEEEIRIHTRFLIEKCYSGGGWALGSGNSVANYINIFNLLAMLEEGFNFSENK